MKTADVVRFSSALCLTLAPVAGAGAQVVSEPAPIIGAFNETCRRGFPDLATVREQAESVGWAELSGQMVVSFDDPRLGRADLPQLLFKGDMTLIMSAQNAAPIRSTCAISVSAGQTLDTAGLARAVSAALGGAEASIAMERGVEQASWRLASGLVVKASVGKSGDARRAHLTVLTR
ncbi:MAG TPA: hypothetical protein VF650_13115 [Allosphingosinicella sp.]|jgi:hypothetical protein